LALFLIVLKLCWFAMLTYIYIFTGRRLTFRW